MIRTCYRAARTAAQNLRYYLNRAWLRNPASRRRFKDDSPSLSPTQQRVVSELRRDGISVVTFDELFADRKSQVLAPFKSLVDEFVSSDFVRNEAEQYQKNHEKLSGKDYVIRYYRKQRQRSINDPIFRLGLEPELIDTVNSYAEMWMQLINNDIWYTVPVAEVTTRKTSQNWHRDYEDEVLVKVFLYCNEVDENSGPFEYISRSRRGEPNFHNSEVASGIIKDGFYPNSDAVERELSSKDLRTCLCPAYTFVFCDTSGLHRGGFAKLQPRIVATWAFLTPASLCPPGYQLATAEGESNLKPAAKAAILSARTPH